MRLLQEDEIGASSGGCEGIEVRTVPPLSDLLSAWIRGRAIAKGISTGSVFARKCHCLTLLTWLVSHSEPHLPLWLGRGWSCLFERTENC